MVEKLLGERLARSPDARDAAIARVQRARVQRGAVERYPGGGDALAKGGEKLAVIGQKAALGEKPCIQARRGGGERAFAVLGGKRLGRRCRPAPGAVTGAAPALALRGALQGAFPAAAAPASSLSVIAAPGSARN